MKKEDILEQIVSEEAVLIQERSKELIEKFHNYSWKMRRNFRNVAVMQLYEDSLVFFLKLRDMMATFTQNLSLTSLTK